MAARNLLCCLNEGPLGEERRLPPDSGMCDLRERFNPRGLVSLPRLSRVGEPGASVPGPLTWGLTPTQPAACQGGSDNLSLHDE